MWLYQTLQTLSVVRSSTSSYFESTGDIVQRFRCLSCTGPIPVCFLLLPIVPWALPGGIPAQSQKSSPEHPWVWGKTKLKRHIILSTWVQTLHMSVSLCMYMYISYFSTIICPKSALQCLWNEPFLWFPNELPINPGSVLESAEVSTGLIIPSLIIRLLALLSGRTFHRRTNFQTQELPPKEKKKA